MQSQQTVSENRQAPFVTFIITYYNQPIPLLLKCINSIMDLSLNPAEREIILIDDGSEVSPMNGLMPYSNDIIYVRQKNQGLSMARNAGINMAKGQYLQFVDADDNLVAAPYEHCLDIIRTDTDVEMVMFDFTSNTDNQSTFSDQPIVSGTEYMLKNNIHGTACGYLFKRTVLSDLRFTSGIWHEDEEFTPQLLIRTERLCVTNAKAYYYYKHSGTITTHSDEKSNAKRLNDIRGILTRLNYLADRIPHTDRIAMQRRIAQLTMDYIYKVIILQHSQKTLSDCLEDLRQEGLFPLPNRNYSPKYVWFRRLTNTAIGRSILLHTLPMLKKER